MLHAQSRMCTCMQTNKKVEVKKSGTLNGEATGLKDMDHWSHKSRRAGGEPQGPPLHMPCCRFNIFAHLKRLAHLNMNVWKVKCGK